MVTPAHWLLQGLWRMWDGLVESLTSKRRWTWAPISPLLLESWTEFNASILLIVGIHAFFYITSLLNLSQHYSSFMFLFSGWETCGIFAPWLGIEPIPNALEGKVLTTGPPGKSAGVRIFLAWIPINLYIATESTKQKMAEEGPWPHLLHAKYFSWGFPSGAVVKNPPANVRNIRDTSREDPVEKEMEIYSSILAWRIPWTEEPGGLRSMGS